MLMVIICVKPQFWYQTFFKGTENKEWLTHLIQDNILQQERCSTSVSARLPPPHITWYHVLPTGLKP